MQTSRQSETVICEKCNSEFTGTGTTVKNIDTGEEKHYPPAQKKCKKCTEIDRLAAELEQRKKWSEEAEERARDSWGAEINIPARFCESSFDNFQANGEMAKKVDVVKSYLKEPYSGDGSMVLFSPNLYGVGKTHLVCALALALLCNGPVGFVDKEMRFHAHRPGILFVSEPSMLLRLRSTFQSGSDETESDVYNSLAKSLLIIDDVGKIKPRDMAFTHSVYFQIIDSAYCHKTDIIITTNLNPTELENHIGGAAADRLKEMAKFIEIKGKSYRKAQS